MIWIETADLVTQAQAGDRAAYGELVRRFQPTVYALALVRLRNAVEAQELAQEVFVHAMLKLSQLREAACFPGWLRQITVRMALNRLSRRAPLSSAEEGVLENTRDRGQSPLDQMVRSENRGQVWDGLERLKPVDRDTLVAFYIRGRSLKQMSRDFETPVGTIKRRLHVARNRLKRELETDASPRREPTRELVMS
jgi:RNA polymerase sigma-70 factor (ECF subfamily)